MTDCLGGLGDTRKPIHSLGEAEVKKLRKIFNAVDIDNDKELTHDELREQPEANQSSRKVCYYMDHAKAPATPEIQRLLRAAGCRARVACTRRRFLDIVPIRRIASPSRSVMPFHVPQTFSQVSKPAPLNHAA